MKNWKTSIFKDYRELAIRFTPYAWSKIRFVNSLAYSEFSAFGISNPHDLLLVEDIAIIKQINGACTTRFDDVAVADFFEEQVDLGRQPKQFGRIWIHSHPNGNVIRTNKKARKKWQKFNNDYRPSPSTTDENTFRDAFGNCDWSVMFIYGGSENAYARLALRQNGFDGSILLPVEVLGNGRKPTSQDRTNWRTEFEENVEEKKYNFSIITKKDLEEFENGQRQDQFNQFDFD